MVSLLLGRREWAVARGAPLVAVTVPPEYWRQRRGWECSYLAAASQRNTMPQHPTLRLPAALIPDQWHLDVGSKLTCKLTLDVHVYVRGGRRTPSLP